MCKSNGESIDHLFLHCELARKRWRSVLGRCKLLWTMPNKVMGKGISDIKIRELFGILSQVFWFGVFGLEDFEQFLWIATVLV